jgi:hypothetical protein
MNLLDCEFFNSSLPVTEVRTYLSFFSVVNLCGPHNCIVAAYAGLKDYEQRCVCVQCYFPTWFLLHVSESSRIMR